MRRELSIGPNLYLGAYLAVVLSLVFGQPEVRGRGWRSDGSNLCQVHRPKG